VPVYVATVGGRDKPPVICSFPFLKRKLPEIREGNVWRARTSIQNPHEEGICGLGVLPQDALKF